MMDLGGLLRESGRVLKGNYQLAIPSFLSVFATRFLALAYPPSPDDLQTTLIWLSLSFMISFQAHGISIAMADEALRTGATSLVSALRAGARLFLPIWASSVLVLLAVGAGSALFIVPGLAAAFLSVYVLPAIVRDGAGPLGAIRLSYKTVVANFRDSLHVTALMMAAGLALAVLGAAMGSFKNFEMLIEAVLAGIMGGALSVFLLRAYDTLRKASA